MATLGVASADASARRSHRDQSPKGDLEPMVERPPDEWTLLAQRPGPAGYLKVVTNTYRLPDGSYADWDLLTGPDVVAILALTAADQVVLARQFRPGPGRLLDELPGGRIEQDESPAAGAARELMEETGYAGDVEIAGKTWTGASFTRRQWAAVATNCSRVAEQTLDHNEFCAPITLSLQEFRGHLRSGQLTDAGVAYLALDHLGLL